MTTTHANKIDKRDVEDILGLSPLQEGLLFHYVTEPDSAQYVEQLTLRLEGEIRFDWFQRSWQSVMDANEMLRTVFRWEKLEKPVQIVLKRREPRIVHLDLSHEAAHRQEAVLEEVQKRDKAEGIHLENEPFRLTLCQLSQKSCALIVTYHHILFDGWSTGIVLKEFMSAYQALSGNQTWRAPVKTKFKQFIAYIQSQDRAKTESFWRGYLSDFQTKTPLPLDKRKKEQTTVTHYEHLDAGQELSGRLSAFAKQQACTIADLIYGAWGLLLHKYGNTDDIVFGTTVSGRIPAIRGVEEMVGLLINTLPLRLRIEGGMSAASLLEQVSASVGQREDFQTVPLADMKAYAGFTGKESLFDSIVVIENYPLDEAVTGTDGGLKLVGHSMMESTNYPLALTVTSLEPLQFQLQYNAELFKTETIRSLGRHFLRLLGSLTDGDAAIASINMLDAAEIKRLTEDYNRTAVSYPAYRSVHDMFEEQAERTPDAVALRFLDQTMTYGELNRQANRVARFVRSCGAGENDVVGIMAERSMDMIVGIFGILKAGAAYVPIDPDYPEERIAYLLGHSRTQLLLTSGNGRAGVPNDGNTRAFAVADIVRGADGDDSREGGNLNLSLDPDRLFYVLYTSGSTGNPKGVMIRSHAFVNLLHWFTQEFGIGADDHALLIAPSSFDLAQKNLYATLITGGTLTLFEPGPYDYNRMSDAIHEHRITLVNCSPSAFYPLVDFNENSGFVRLASLREVFLGGEPINVNRLDSWVNSRRFHAEIVNTYGPTECTDIAAFHRMGAAELTQSAAVPIGKPIYNATLYVMDASRNLLPEGMIGELYIGGVGLAKGYYHAPELTEERFVPHPLIDGERLYRTGDLVRWLPDGNLDYIGRTDYQVKIRGMRIELAEIEAALLRHDAVKEAVVIVWQNASGSSSLCAYLVGPEQEELDEVRDYAGRMLPDYMVPSFFIPMERLPLTPNGKIDKKSLPEPQLARIGASDSAAAGSATELKLVSIWQQILGLERVGLEEPFFDIGGNSILLFKLHSEIERSYPGTVKITDLFAFPTIARIAKHIDDKMKPHLSVYPLSYVIMEDELAVDDTNENGSVTFDIPSEWYEALVHAANESGVQPEEACFSMFLYMLGQFASAERMELPWLLPDGQWLPLEADLGRFEDFDDLFRYVRGARQSDERPSYAVEQMEAARRPAGGIVPAFAWNHGDSPLRGSSGENTPFDLLWGMSASADSVQVTCSFDPSFVSEALVREMAEGYAELIRMFAERKVGETVG